MLSGCVHCGCPCGTLPLRQCTARCRRTAGAATRAQLVSAAPRRRAPGMQREAWRTYLLCVCGGRAPTANGFFYLTFFPPYAREARGCGVVYGLARLRDQRTEMALGLAFLGVSRFDRFHDDDTRTHARSLHHSLTTSLVDARYALQSQRSGFKHKQLPTLALLVF